MMQPSRIIFALLALGLPLLAGCWKENMGSQPKAKPMQESVFFADGTTARPLVGGTVARGDLELDSHLYRGFVDGQLALTFPEHYPTETDGPFPTRGPACVRRLHAVRNSSRFIVQCAMAMRGMATASLPNAVLPAAHVSP